MRDNPVKRTLADGGWSLGTFVAELATPAIGRVAASGGAEFMILDQEHSGLSLESVKSIVWASRPYDIVPIVRVPDAHYHLVAGALDVEALGVLVPLVEDLDEARSIVSWAKYPPQGERGCGMYYPDIREPGGLGATQAHHNAELLTLVQIESVKGLEIVEEIASIDGIDVLWVGQIDLTTSMGIPGELDDPRYHAALATVGAAARKHGKAAGMVVQRTHEARLAVHCGFRMLAYSGDLWLLQRGLQEGLAALRELLPVQKHVVR